ncbi:hypothetical protein LSTR_LSTR013956 [Laodelphax striatellus]|uniref:Uncharacterized protein n=1 Tax=Laodelphax striatellus TaxID=195883 RepID=A0A482WQP7_LAOST|nr:hypothetical protein LSTR_LSTR013956 [Laodelphax striatellus]
MGSVFMVNRCCTQLKEGSTLALVPAAGVVWSEEQVVCNWLHTHNWQLTERRAARLAAEMTAEMSSRNGGNLPPRLP